MAADCKSAGLTPYEGSNPSPTIRAMGVGRGRWAERCAGVAQLVERKPSKLDVAGSSPVSRSSIWLVRVAVFKKLQEPLQALLT